MPSLTGDRWRRLETLFAAACELPPEERSAFVDRETAGDADLRRDLAGMLAHAADGGALIARAIDGVAALQSSAGSWIDRRVGPYRIVREIGRGGMGLVFEAVRDDDEYRKTVALKIAPPWIDAAALRERFRLERWSSSMQPSIAPSATPIAKSPGAGVRSGRRSCRQPCSTSKRARRSCDRSSRCRKPSLCVRRS